MPLHYDHSAPEIMQMSTYVRPSAVPKKQMLSESNFKPIFLVSRVNPDTRGTRAAGRPEMKRSRGKPLIDISIYRKKSLSHIR